MYAKVLINFTQKTNTTMGIELNTSQFLQLNNDIRITSNSVFNAQEAYENAFEDVLNEEVIKINEENQKTNKINFYNLGAPAGFFLDNSLLEEMELNNSNLSNSENKNFNPYLMMDD